MPSLSYSEQNRTNDFRNVLQCEAREPVWTGSKSGPGRLQLSGFFQEDWEDFDLFGFRYFRISDFDGVEAWQLQMPRCRILVGTSVEAGGRASDTRYARSQGVENDSK